MNTERGIAGLALTIGAWVGNLILTGLAFYLAFSAQGPLQPGLFLTIALCIFAGNALPLAAGWLDYAWRKLELQGHGAESARRVRDALVEARQLTERIKEVQGAAAKAVLIGRQLPERIEGQAQRLEAAAGAFDSLAPDGLAPVLEALEAEVRGMAVAVAGLEHKVEGGASALAERVALLERAVEGVAARSAPMAQDAVRYPTDAAVEETVEMAEVAAPNGEVVEDEMEDEAVDDEVAAEAIEQVEEEAVAEAEVELAATEEAKVVEGKRRRRRAELEVGQEELGLELAAAEGGPEAVLKVHAMIGIANRLCIRGDGPGMDWEAGKALELVGIGEYEWRGELAAPMRFKLYLNDRVEAEGEVVELNPGETLRLQPVFAK